MKGNYLGASRVDAKLIFWPAVAMVALTFSVQMRMYATRIGEMKRERIHPQSIASSAQAAARLKDTRAADNFRNLFEMPVLFYPALIVAFLTAQVGVFTLSLAWAFVALRIAHSAIQCSYNKVMHRFHAYVSSSVVLWILWGVLVCGLPR
ncbi:MAPEG family protein [Rudaea sp.]|uniref:MAPEG family protein n=1 Tax=Rudaea sp. TaxID=2136325 RepID=UPI00378368E8